MRRRTVLLATLALAALVVAAIVVSRRRTPSGSDDAAEPSAGERETGEREATGLSSPPDGRLAGRGLPSSVAQEPERAVRVLGRVVDGQRRPVAGATVTIVTVEPPVPGVTTDADGRFAIRTATRTVYDSTGEKHAVIAIRAEHEPEGFALEGSVVHPPEEDVGTLELSPLAPVTVRVTAKGSPVAGALVTAREWTGPVAGVARVAEATTGAAGEAVLRGVRPLPFDETIDFLAIGPDGRRGRTTTRHPGAVPTAIPIEIHPSRSLTVRVTDERESPIAGAKIERLMTDEDRERPMPPEAGAAIVPTGADGRTSFGGVFDAWPVALRVSAVGFAPSYDDARLEPRERERSIVLTRTPAAVTLTFPVEPGDAPTPSAGAALVVKPWPGQAGRSLRAQATFEEGRVVARDVVLVSGRLMDDNSTHAAIAVAPDGAMAVLDVGGAHGEGLPTSFVRPRRITVHARDERGVPVADLGVSIIDLDRCRTYRWIVESESAAWQRTDAEGSAAFDDLPARKFWLWVEGAPFQELDLTSESASVDVSIGAEREVELHVTVEGKPRLPPDVSANFGSYAHETGPVSRDFEHGILRARCRPRDPAADGEVRVSASDLQEGGARFRWPEPGGTVVVPVELAYQSRLVLGISIPVGSRFDVAIQTKGDGDEWKRPGEGVLTWEADGPGEHEFVLDEPRTVRAFDRVTHIASDAVEVRAQADSTRLSLDLTKAYEVTGRVVVPEGYDHDLVRLVREGFDDAARDERPATRLLDDGESFRVRVPLGRTVTIRAEHPLLVGAGSGGEGARVTVSDARSDVVLRLEVPR